MRADQYFLVWQDRPFIEQWTRENANDLWVWHRHFGLAAVITLPSLNITLALSEIYTDVQFPAVAVYEPDPPATPPR